MSSLKAKSSSPNLIFGAQAPKEKDVGTVPVWIKLKGQGLTSEISEGRNQNLSYGGKTRLSPPGRASVSLRASGVLPAGTLFGRSTMVEPKRHPRGAMVAGSTPAARAI